MNMKNRLFSIIFSVACSVIPVLGADNAMQLLEKAAANIKSMPSLKANYTINISGQGSATGVMTLSGDMFVMTSADLMTWYDGTTQWTMVMADNEVNVTEPTADELRQVNPFVIINNFRNSYSASSLKAETGQKKLLLKAKNAKEPIAETTVTLNAATLLPTQIELKLKNNRTVSIKVTGIQKGKSLPVETFRFPAKKYPSAEIVDLR